MKQKTLANGGIYIIYPSLIRRAVTSPAAAQPPSPASSSRFPLCIPPRHESVGVCTEVLTTRLLQLVDERLRVVASGCAGCAGCEPLRAIASGWSRPQKCLPTKLMSFPFLIN